MYDDNYMDRVTSQLPRYMKKNLKEMPNNKGYIFKNVWFYGELPRQRKEQIMFEKRGDILRIHKITEKQIIISEKDQKTGKTRVISKEKRIPMFQSFTLKN